MQSRFEWSFSLITVEQMNKYLQIQYFLHMRQFPACPFHKVQGLTCPHHLALNCQGPGIDSSHGILIVLMVNCTSILWQCPPTLTLRLNLRLALANDTIINQIRTKTGKTFDQSFHFSFVSHDNVLRLTLVGEESHIKN